MYPVRIRFGAGELINKMVGFSQFKHFFMQKKFGQNNFLWDMFDFIDYWR